MPPRTPSGVSVQGNKLLDFKSMQVHELEYKIYWYGGNEVRPLEEIEWLVARVNGCRGVRFVSLLLRSCTPCVWGTAIAQIVVFFSLRTHNGGSSGNQPFGGSRQTRRSLRKRASGLL